MRTILTILAWGLNLYSLMIIARALFLMLHPSGNRWTVLLQRITEPVLAPLRSLLARLFPRLPRNIDFSPVAAVLLIQLLERIILRMAR